MVCISCILVLAPLCLLATPQYSSPTVWKRHGGAKNEKLQAVRKGNKLQKIIEKLLERNNHKKREVVDKLNPKDIISNQLETEPGLAVVIRQLIQNKLQTLREEAGGEKSAVELLLAQSNRQETFLDHTVGREQSFLDRLIAVMKQEETKENNVLKKTRKPKLVTLNAGDEERDEDRPIRFFENVGLIRDSKPKKVTNQRTRTGKGKGDGLKFFADAGLFRSDSESTEDLDDDAEEDNSSSDSSSDLTSTFLEEEINAAESETAFLADEIAELLVQLEADLSLEDQMMEKSHDMIQAKIRRFPLEKLLKDKDFIDSVFIRFALMRLPLRTQDIDVSESFQISKVLQASMAQASAETRSLLQDLRSEPLDGGEGRDRARAIDQSRRQLQRLLKIVSRKT